MTNYRLKYLKYKQKYLNLKFNLTGSAYIDDIRNSIEARNYAMDLCKDKIKFLKQIYDNDMVNIGKLESELIGLTDTKKITEKNKTIQDLKDVLRNNLFTIKKENSNYGSAWRIIIDQMADIESIREEDKESMKKDTANQTKINEQEKIETMQDKKWTELNNLLQLPFTLETFLQIEEKINSYPKYTLAK